MKVDPRKLVADPGSVPSLPLIFDQIKDAINDPNGSTTLIGDVISRDSGLTARLLRIANSALYSFPSKVDTISQAVIVIGIQQLRDLALGTSVVELFDGISQDLVDMKQFWKHSVACGITARVLASYRREANVERHFVAGLLHDIGRLIIYLKLPNEAKAILTQCRSSQQLMHKVEREIMECDHSEIGSALLETWRLPANLMDAVLYHHSPTKSTRYPTEAAIVHVADIFTNAMEIGSSGEHFVPQIVPEAWNSLGLSTSIIAPALAEIDRQYQDSIDMFLEKTK